MVSNHYNPWPLGQLSLEMQRPEPERIKQLGYKWDDPRDIVDIFEQKLADYANSRFAVVTDACTNAMFLSLKLREASGAIVIPAQS